MKSIKEKAIRKRILGTGSYGKVYLVKWEGEYKAVKVIADKMENGIEHMVEIDIMSRLRHPNIVPIEDVEIMEVGNKIQISLVMPLASADLSNYMMDKSLTYVQRIQIINDIANGLKFIHENNALHLDLKLENVLIFEKDNEITASITDYGISLYAYEGQRVTNRTLVTVTYRPIEIFNGSCVYNKAVDIWSFGVIILTILTNGKNLFNSNNARKIKSTIKNELNSAVIEITLRKYLNHLGEPYLSQWIDLLKQLFEFNPDARPNINTILEHKLLKECQLHLYKKAEMYAYPTRVLPSPQVIIANTNIHAYAFDGLYQVFIMGKIAVKLETIFMTGTLYNRLIPYMELDKNIKLAWAKAVLYMTACLFISSNLLLSESTPLEPKIFIKLFQHKFNCVSLYKTIAEIVEKLKGRLYTHNPFYICEDIDSLYKAFSVIHNCAEYSKLFINKSKERGNKFDMDFLTFFKETKHYQHIINGSERKEYIR